MATIKNFEDLEIWKHAKTQAENIYKLSQSFRNEQFLYNQLNAAAGSVMDNIAEGFERNSTKEMIQFLFISKGSNGEVRSQLIRAYCFKLLMIEEMNSYKDLNLQITRQIYSFINYLRSSPFRSKK